jgi:redox-sensitive bicupin YhaK (pirin superfamily)
MSSNSVQRVFALGMPWQTLDPFLFCVHHDDAYPAGNPDLGPAASLVGRRIGMDFEGKDGWRMYHGDVVPGFPRHPHRGFETVTVARHGFIDHADSMGATARFGQGDVQWMTAGRGVVHSEMFPLIKADGPNPAELFQIWLNLPRAKKMVDPYFTMLWSHTIPRIRTVDSAGRATVVSVYAGRYGDAAPPAPPPDSWANHPDSHLAIWTVRLDAGAVWSMPACPEGVNRVLYVFHGEIAVDGVAVAAGQGAQIRPGAAVSLTAAGEQAEALLLQGRPIGEPVAQHGPFVMSTQDEIRQAYADYRATGFGGWPWKRDDPVHERHKRRFAVHADGRLDVPPGSGGG